MLLFCIATTVNRTALLGRGTLTSDSRIYGKQCSGTWQKTNLFMLAPGMPRTSTENYAPAAYFLGRRSTFEGIMGRSGASNCASVSP